MVLGGVVWNEPGRGIVLLLCVSEIYATQFGAGSDSAGDGLSVSPLQGLNFFLPTHPFGLANARLQGGLTSRRAYGAGTVSKASIFWFPDYQFHRKMPILLDFYAIFA